MRLSIPAGFVVDAPLQVALEHLTRLDEDDRRRAFWPQWKWERNNMRQTYDVQPHHSRVLLSSCRC